MDNSSKLLIAESAWTLLYLAINPFLPPSIQGSWAIFTLIIILAFLDDTKLNRRVEE